MKSYKMETYHPSDGTPSPDSIRFELADTAPPQRFWWVVGPDGERFIAPTGDYFVPLQGSILDVAEAYQRALEEHASEDGAIEYDLANIGRDSIDVVANLIGLSERAERLPVVLVRATQNKRIEIVWGHCDEIINELVQVTMGFVNARVKQKAVEIVKWLIGYQDKLERWR